MKYCSKCSKTASYGDINEGFAKYCSGCSTGNNIVDFKHGYCQYIKNESGKLLSERLCAKNANYNYLNCSPKKGIRCLDHRDAKMVCINSKICIDCKKDSASFVLENSKRKSAMYCKSCAEKYKVKIIDVVHKKCKECHINSAIFGLLDKKEFCGDCAKKLQLDVVDLHHKKCIMCNEKQALFNDEGGPPLYCGNCKEIDMININGLKCEVENCYTTPVYNYPGELKKRFCENHKLEGMINVKDKLCIICNIKRPSFNYGYEKTPDYCSDCKSNDMINIYYDRCEHEGCNENAWYNCEGEDKRKFCKNHASENMVLINLKLCEMCNKVPTYGYIEDNKRVRCLEHKDENMIDLQHGNCIFENCTRRAYFNFCGKKKTIYCSDHKIDGMINIEHKLCKTYLCGTRVSDKYEGYCLYCFINLFPDKPISRNYKTKEKAVVEYILQNFSDFTWNSDKKIQDGCSKRRPDLLLDLGYQIIIVEIDENQHIGYDESCENKRLMEISQDLGHRPIIFIRFNPDEYIEDGITKHSCWSFDKNGISKVKKSYCKIWNERLETLKNTINYWVDDNHISEKTIELIYLFFDKN